MTQRTSCAPKYPGAFFSFGWASGAPLDRLLASNLVQIHVYGGQAIRFTCLSDIYLLSIDLSLTEGGKQRVLNLWLPVEGDLNDVSSASLDYVTIIGSLRNSELPHGEARKRTLREIFNQDTCLAGPKTKTYFLWGEFERIVESLEEKMPKGPLLCYLAFLQWYAENKYKGALGSDERVSEALFQSHKLEKFKTLHNRIIKALSTVF